MAYVALSRVRTLNGLHLLSFDPLSVKKSKGKKRKIQVTGIIDDGEPCSKNAKVSVSHVQSTSNSTVSSNKRKSTDLQKSNRPIKSKICDDNALNKPCPQKRKVDVDSSTDNTALVLPRPKTDDKLIVSINLKDLKTKFNVKDDDSCSSLIVSIKLSKIKCKPKDDKTKCVVINYHCSSSLIVSIKLSSIKLKTSNPKKDDDVIFTYEEPPNPDNVRRRQRYYVYYPANEDVQRRWCEILNLKFVTAARILPGSPTTPLSDERVPNSTLDVPGDGNCLFYALSYLITGSISQHYELRRAIVSNMPNFEEELFNSTLSATRYSSIYDYINKSKMYRNYVWATDTEIITLTALLGITIYSYSLTPTF
uniref:OTU domain-containing protein n=1 Tax=Amphimedon queenslandica TaxID=400682 RepID=A0A1X7UGW5_AMPQE